MRINYEGYAETKDGRRFPIKVDSYGRFVVSASAVSGAINDLVGDSPEDIQADLDAWLAAAEGELEYQREQRRDYAKEKKQRAEKVVNADAWLITRHNRYHSPETDQEFLDSVKINQVKVRGRKARSRSSEALITLAGTNTSRSVTDLKLGTAADLQEYKTLLLAAWKANQAAEEAKSAWRYKNFYFTGYAPPNPEFKQKVENAVATYNGDGTWTFSAEGIEDFVLNQDEFRTASSAVERRLAAVAHPYTMRAVNGLYSGPRQILKVLPMAEYEGSSTPDYVFPDRETAQGVVSLHNDAVKAHEAVEAWNREHRYTYGWEEQNS